MNTIHLKTEELREITGKVKPSAQVRVLRALGLTVKIRPDGRPLVSRAHFEAVMGGFLFPTKTRTVEPDFSGF